MEKKLYYMVATVVPWDSLRHDDGKPFLPPPGAGTAFLPVYESKETAERKWPGHEIITLGAQEPVPPPPRQEDEDDGC
jgi:hypothetical protein